MNTTGEVGNLAGVGAFGAATEILIVAPPKRKATAMVVGNLAEEVVGVTALVAKLAKRNPIAMISQGFALTVVSRNNKL